MENRTRLRLASLRGLLHPKSILVFCDEMERELGEATIRSVVSSGSFKGSIRAVYVGTGSLRGIANVPVFSTLESVPENPDLVVVCMDLNRVPPLIRQLRQNGIKAALLMNSRFQMPKPGQCSEYDACVAQIRAAARQYGVRIIGPGGVGIITPKLGVSCCNVPGTVTQGGSVAFVSQSSTVCGAVLDWALDHKVGFSHFISLGVLSDVTVADILDVLAGCPDTRTVLLFLQTIPDARHFMSAARTLARTRNVIAIMPDEEMSDVCDAAFRRAGILRGFELAELFEAAETLAVRPLFLGQTRRDHVVILSNGRALALEAARILPRSVMQSLSPAVCTELDALFGPKGWSGSNPVYTRSNPIDPELYGKALEILMKDVNNDVVVALHAPTPSAPSSETADGVLQAIRNAKAAYATCGVMTCWMGGPSGRLAQTKLREVGVPVYSNPSDLSRNLRYLWVYHQTQDVMHQVPHRSMFAKGKENVLFVAKNAAIRGIRHALGSGRSELTDEEVTVVLKAMCCHRKLTSDTSAVCSVPSKHPSSTVSLVNDHSDGGLGECFACAKSLGYPVQLELTSKLGPMRLSLGPVYDEPALTELLSYWTERLKGLPSVTCSFSRPKATDADHEDNHVATHPEPSLQPLQLYVAFRIDPVFGPILEIGVSGTTEGRAIGLPPLNTNLASEMISKSSFYHLLKPHQVAGLQLCLEGLSDLIMDVADLQELVVDPLMLNSSPNGHALMAGDARVKLSASNRSLDPSPYRWLAIASYPHEFEEVVTLKSGQSLFIRPVRPDDEPAHHRFYSRLSPQDRLYRFFTNRSEITHSEMQWYTQVDYDREIALIATTPSSSNDDGYETVGWVGGTIDPESESLEFGLVVDPMWKNQGLGKLLMLKLIRCCRMKGVKSVIGIILTENIPMLGLMRALGAKTTVCKDDIQVTEAVLTLREEISSPITGGFHDHGPGERPSVFSGK